jgi:hypothetical protein
MAFDHSLYRLREVLQQVPAIGHLLGLRCSLANGVGIGTGPITTNDLNLRMVP